MIRTIYRTIIKLVVAPYTRAELPGWGKAYALAVGDYRRNWLWAGSRPVWVKGKLHDYFMRLDIGGWSNRATFFLRRFYDLPTQLALIELVKPGDTVVDIGGNEGMMSLLMSQLVGDTGRVIAVEPNPGPRSIFEQNIARNAIANITLLACGLANENAVLELRVPKVNTGEASFGQSHYGETDFTVVETPVRIGDEALADHTPALIKIDVEGFELKVIDGLEATLARARPMLITEVVDAHLRRADASAAELIARLKALGYTGKLLTLQRGKLAYAPIGDTLDVGDVLWTPS